MQVPGVHLPELATSTLTCGSSGPPRPDSASDSLPSPRARMGRSLRDLPKMVNAASANSALHAIARGDIETAYQKAIAVDPKQLTKTDRQGLGTVFYAHGKLLISKGELQRASKDFRSALACNDQNDTFRLRSRCTTQALGDPRRTTVPRRLAVMDFCRDMIVQQNVDLSDLPPAAFLHVAQRAQAIRPPTLALPEAGYLDDFHALGIYRWQGDEKSGDLFTRWVRRLKTGDRQVAEHLGRLLADWLWSETDLLKDIDYVVPVPGEPYREGARGFNPPDVFASAVQDALGVPVLAGALVRRESVRARETGSYEEVRTWFKQGRSGRKIQAQNVLLLDDVARRGFTLRACSQLLRSSGAKRVLCVVLAQSISTLREERALDG